MSNASNDAAKPRPDLRAVETASLPPPAPEAELDPAARQLARRRAAVRARARARAAAQAAGEDMGSAGAGSAGAVARPDPSPAPRHGPLSPGARPRPMDLAAAAAAPEVRHARLRRRHWAAIAAFVLMVLVPFAAATSYLYLRAAPQYHSEVAFSIRSEDAGGAAAGLLGALTSMGTGSASDVDILNEYVQSQGIVQAIDAELDLRALYNRADDPVFALGPDATIEDLVAYWGRMVDVSFESSAGIIHVRADAFTPEDAQAIAQAILERSSALVNALSDQAREDAVRFAREELAEAEANLAAMRARLSDFRRENRIVDPAADVAGQMGLLNALQGELAQALVERDTLLSYADAGDQRVQQVNRRIDAIRARIDEERGSLGVPGTDEALPEVVGRYEELLVDLEFANTAYTQALGGLAAARAEARRQSRYLAPHVEPTLAQKALYPRRALLSGLTGLFLLLGWGTLMLVYYNIRDNR
jgi:capsular polysaccharide transport system permease protein